MPFGFRKTYSFAMTKNFLFRKTRLFQDAGKKGFVLSLSRNLRLDKKSPVSLFRDVYISASFVS
jgi:hypothetical protein